MDYVRRLAGVLVMLALCAGPASAQEADHWIWPADEAGAPDIRRVSIDLVRGGVRIVRRPGPTRLEIRRSSPAGLLDAAGIAVKVENEVLRVSDTYLSLAPYAVDECLPLLQRGDFWSSDVQHAVTVYAGDAVVIDVRIMEKRSSGQSPPG